MDSFIREPREFFKELKANAERFMEERELVLKTAKEHGVGKRVQIINSEKTWANGQTGTVKNVLLDTDDIGTWKYVVKLDDMDETKPPYGLVNFWMWEMQFLEDESSSSDPVNHPSHYTDGKYEVIDFLEATNIWRNFYFANAVKYICRAGKKDPDKKQEDLNKALWYLKRYVEFCKKSVVTGINTSDFIKDKGLEGTPGGMAIELILDGNAELAIKALEINNI